MSEILKNGGINGNAHLVSIDYHFDERGSFSTLMPLATRYFSFPPKQINISHNNLTGTVRGLHLQKPLEMKIIKCVQGNIFDVIVDCRKDSENFGKWESFELSGDDNKALFIPRGYAHGFQTMTDDSKIIYRSEEHTSELQSH